jgi:CRP/FNR family cyclic AMP-dependent transcriptional regulator
MLTTVERVLILRGADLLREVAPRRLLRLAEVAREVELSKGGTIYREEDAADALYMMVEGRVRLSARERTIAEVGPGEAFGTWALVDDSARGQRAECIEDGLALAVHRDEFYDVAAGDLRLLQEVVRALARRLRALVSERPEEARVEGEGAERPDALVKTETFESDAAANAAPPNEGTALSAAVMGKSDPKQEPPAAST